MLETITSHLFKVLDLQRTGLCKHADLIEFMPFVIEELDLEEHGEFSDEQVDEMLREIDVHDLNKISQTHLREFLRKFITY
jgi:Ca2+-binding EF-hand superfamily protein